jgi:hypothetical protein
MTPLADSLAAKCVLLFSGGRDSTLAAIKLARKYQLVLLTIRGEHLIGFDAVVQRAIELRRAIPETTEWFLVETAPMNRQEALRGCMSCQLTATAAAVQLAKRVGATVVSTGFAGYQRAWIEQSPEAEEILRHALARDGLRLELPAATIKSKEQAVAELRALSLTTEPLEQKCVSQQLNPSIEKEERSSALKAWESNLLSVVGQRQRFEFLGPYLLADVGDHLCLQ